MASIQPPAIGGYHSRPPFGRAGARPAAVKSAWGPSKPNPAKASPVGEPAIADGHFRIRRVFSRTFGVFGSNFVTILALIALAAIPERAVVHLMGFDNRHVDIASKATLALSGLALQLAVMHLALSSFAGSRTGFGECVRQAIRSYLPVIAMGALAILPLAAAALLLAVPGLMLATAWSVIVPVRVAEGAGIFACFKRSSDLTRGHRWKIVGIFLLLGLLLALPILALQPLWGVPLAAHAQFFAANWLARLIFYAACGLLLASVYYELRQADAMQSAWEEGKSIPPKVSSADQPDPAAIKRAKAHIGIYILGAVLSAFGAFMFYTLGSDDLANLGFVPTGMVMMGACCVALMLAGLYTAFQYWRGGARDLEQNQRAINGRIAFTALMAVGAICAAYANYPIPFPSANNAIRGHLSEVAVDNDGAGAKLTFRLNGRPFAYDCVLRHGPCRAYSEISLLPNRHPQLGSVIPIGGTVLSFEADGRSIISADNETAPRLKGALQCLLLALLLGGIAFGDFRGYPAFRKPLKGASIK